MSVDGQEQNLYLIKNEGFTLLDLLIVVMILGIVGMIAIPRYNSLIADAALDGAAGEMVSGLQYAGNLAARYQRPFGFLSDAAGRTFRVYDYRYRNDAAGHVDVTPPVTANGVVQNPIDKSWYIKDLNLMKTYDGVSITNGEIRFYPDGHSSSAASTVTVQYAGKQKTITVNGTTGRVSVQ